VVEGIDMDILSLLPSSSFVPFTAYKMAFPKIAWFNEEIATRAVLLNCAYALPIEGEPATAFSKETRECHAEAYGGRGLGSNGGGARCGIVGEVQIKGIGQTPMLGAKSDAAHSYGGASLQEVVREALWGEICHLALPLGAVRSLGIIETGTEVPYFAQGPGAMAPRALLLRQPALRPAHFMRAPHFVPKTSLDFSDVERTKAAVAGLPAILHRIFGDAAESSNELADLPHCMMEIARRFAKQQAAAQAKRLIHGALTPSNIGLDGSWLDFGTIGMASDYGRAVVSAEPDAWFQFTSLFNPLQELVFHLNKYLPTRATEIPTVSDLIQEYLRTLSIRLRIEFAKLTGIPDSGLSQLKAPIIERFCVCVQTIIARGNRHPFNLYVRGMPEKSGQFHLNTVLREAALSSSPGQMDTALSPHLPDDVLRRELVESNWALRSAYAQASESAGPGGDVHVMLNAIRVNAVVTELCRPALDDRIEQLIAGGDSVADFIGSVVKNATPILCDPKDGFIHLEALQESVGATISVPMSAGAEVDVRSILRSLPDRYLGGEERRRELLGRGEHA
jgi:hypothetical protein